ncbi:hypothetical protein L1049_010968 [Liquidambar formosana]|uniref:KIB1-4 beta-propeller domain-containing protein n=1 Tax=Liquidambar formosana TaxID=63359 RepID=A0AAP0RQB4_LIQFO
MLDLPSNHRFAAVCKNWWIATKSYPEKLQSARDMLPWLMLQTGDTTCKFISISIPRIYSITHEAFYRCSIIFSKKGWLLMIKKPSPIIAHPNYPSYARAFSFIIFNPFTKETINLPPLALALTIKGAFSLLDGTPHTIVMAGNPSNDETQKQLAVWITHAGDDAWTQYTHSCNTLTITIIKTVIMVHELVYCFITSGQVFVFDMVSHTWTDSMDPFSVVRWSVGRNYMAEDDGNIILGYSPNNGHHGFEFYRLNDTKSDWVQLNERYLEDRSWLWTPLKQSFVWKGKEARKILKDDGMIVDSGTYSEHVAPIFCRALAEWADMG